MRRSCCGTSPKKLYANGRRGICGSKQLEILCVKSPANQQALLDDSMGARKTQNFVCSLLDRETRVSRNNFSI
jgi:hypothetical protein